MTDAAKSERKLTNSFTKSRKFPHLDDGVYIVDTFYQDTSTQILRPVLSEDGSRMLQQRKSIVNEGKSLQELEEALSLEDLKMLKRVFQATIRRKLEKLDGLYNIGEKERSLNRDEFVEAFSRIPMFGEFHEHEFELLFNKLDARELGYVNWSDFCNQLIVKYNENECTEENLNFVPFLSKIRVKFSAHNRRDETVRMLTMENPWRFINVSRVGHTLGQIFMHFWPSF